jgi:hypothetical protein
VTTQIAASLSRGSPHRDHPDWHRDHADRCIVITQIAFVITNGITPGAAEAGASDCWTSDTPDCGFRAT